MSKKNRGILPRRSSHQKGKKWIMVGIKHWLSGVSIVSMMLCAPVFAQALPGQECSGQTCGLYLQSAQSMQAQESLNLSQTPLQPAAKGLSQYDDILQISAAGQTSAIKNPGASTAWWLFFAAVSVVFLAGLAAVDGLMLQWRMLRSLRHPKTLVCKIRARV